MYYLINCTPHTINIAGAGSIMPSGTVARVSVKSELKKVITVPALGNINLFSDTFGEVIDLPKPKENTFYIVSRMVKDALPNRDDLVAPGKLIRDDKGNPVACDGLSW